MVAKLVSFEFASYVCLNLAKIHMVAKPYDADSNYPIGLNLAKIHMVAKR